MLRVVTINIWGKQGPWEQRREILKRQLAALEPDLVGFQEVLCFDKSKAPLVGPDTRDEDQARELCEGLGLHVTFGCALDMGFGFRFGNAIASRFPLESVETRRLPNDLRAEPRALTTAIARTPFGPVLFGVTHLAWRFDEAALRLRQVVAIAAEMDRRHQGIEYPAILVGDFNAEPESDEMRFLRGLHVRDARSTYFIDAFAEVGEGSGATFSHANEFARVVGEPERRIDYVYVRGRDGRGWGRPTSARLAFDQAERIRGAEREDESDDQSDRARAIHASDHFGVVVDLEAPLR